MSTFMEKYLNGVHAMKIAFSVILSVLLVFSSFTQAVEPERGTPRERRYFYLGLGLGGSITFFYPGLQPDSYGLKVLMPISLRGGWVATEDLLIGYELVLSFLPLPMAGYGEIKHCFSVRYYPFESFTGFYLEGGGGVLTNSASDCEGGCADEKIDVPYAFLTRAATGYDFVIGTHTQLGVGFKYHTIFYHSTPSHELDLVVEINWFLP